MDLIPDLATVVRVVVALLFLILPGYALTLALLPPGTLDASRRTAVALGSGVGLTAVGGLLLNQLRLGLGGPAWVLLIAVTVTLCIWAAIARGHVARPTSAMLQWWRELGRATRLTSAIAATMGGRSPGRGAYAALSFSMAIVLAIVAFWVARNGAIEQDRAQPFTEFWAVVGQPGDGDLTFGITSHELAPTDYSVRVVSADLSVAFDRVSLEPGQSWKTTVKVPMLPPPASGVVAPGAPTPAPILRVPLRALLFRAGASTPYRELSIHGANP
jgi:uncharacterized membrane protein